MRSNLAASCVLRATVFLYWKARPHGWRRRRVLTTRFTDTEHKGVVCHQHVCAWRHASGANDMGRVLVTHPHNPVRLNNGLTKMLGIVVVSRGLRASGEYSLV